MPIISIERDWGTNPSAVRISTTDTIAQVEVPGYFQAQAAVISEIKGGTFTFLRSDALMIYASDGSNIYEFTDDALTTIAIYILDYNGNLVVNNLIEGYTETETDASTTELTVASTEIQNFTGTMTQDVIMPDVTTLVLGQSYLILNNSSDVVTVKSFDLSVIQAMAAGTQMRLICISLTDETETGWDSDYTIQVEGVSSITGTANQVIVSSPTGNVTLSLPQDIATTSRPSFVNVLEGFTTTATAAGTTTLLTGSNKIQEFTGATTQTVVMPVTSTLVAGQTYYIINNSSGVVTVQASGGATIQAMAAGTSLLLTCVLTSGTTAASWESAYFADAGVSPPGSSGTVLRSNGSAWVASTSTFADTYAVSTILYASGSNAVSGLATANRAVMTTGATGIPVMTALATDGQLIVGSTAGAPAAATLTAGAGVSVTNASNSITIAATGGGLTVATIAGTTQAAAVNTKYFALNAGQTTLTLPAVYAVGDIIALVGATANTGGWIVATQAGDTVRVNNATTSAGGTVTSAAIAGQTIYLECDVANTSWIMTQTVSTILTTS